MLEDYYRLKYMLKEYYSIRGLLSVQIQEDYYR